VGQNKKLIEQWALVVAAVPALAYWLAYVYQYGYCKYFEIPAVFIDVSLKNVLVCVFGIIVFLFYLSTIFEFIWSIMGNMPRVVKSKLRITVYPIFYAAAIAFSFRISLLYFLISTGPLIGLIFLYEFILPLITHRNCKTYIEKLEQAQNDDFSYDSATDFFAKKIGHFNYSILFKLGELSVLALFLGSLNGYLKTDFMVSKAQDKIVLKMYNSKFLTAKYDNSNNSYQLLLELIDAEKLGQFNYQKLSTLKLSRRKD